MLRTEQFYSDLAPLYHLIFPDWEGSVRRQGELLDAILRDTWGGEIRSVLDAACGIGTQTLGLALLAYDVTASDLSVEAVARARREATARALDVHVCVGDMRRASERGVEVFDVVIACDNAVPHLLSDAEILTAFEEFHRCVRPGGGCLISVRDYAEEDLSQAQIKPYGRRRDGDTEWLLWQVWEPHGVTYDLTLYMVEGRGESECRTHVFRATYYAVGIPRLMELMAEAGFQDVRRLDGVFFQPVIVGTKQGGRRHAIPEAE